MTLDYILGGLVTVFLLAYLTVALIKPESASEHDPGQRTVQSA